MARALTHIAWSREDETKLAAMKRIGLNRTEIAHRLGRTETSIDDQWRILQDREVARYTHDWSRDEDIALLNTASRPVFLRRFLRGSKQAAKRVFDLRRGYIQPGEKPRLHAGQQDEIITEAATQEWIERLRIRKEIEQPIPEPQPLEQLFAQHNELMPKAKLCVVIELPDGPRIKAEDLFAILSDAGVTVEIEDLA